MSNQLQENLDAILLDKNTNLKPENLKEGVTCLGVDGIMQSGIDTSDANATVNDIAQDKTAYVNGEKITGTLKDVKNGYIMNSNTVINTVFQLRVLNDTEEDLIMRSGSSFSIKNSIVAEEIGLTADKIKAGETILGITGTYTGENDVSL